MVSTMITKPLRYVPEEMNFSAVDRGKNRPLQAAVEIMSQRSAGTNRAQTTRGQRPSSVVAMQTLINLNRASEGIPI